jgi:hypothetical protein
MLATSIPYTLALSHEEWRLVRSLREVPPSPLRDRLCDLLEELVDFVANPGCPEMQADGAPCDGAHMSCDRCQKMLDIVGALRARVREA